MQEAKDHLPHLKVLPTGNRAVTGLAVRACQSVAVLFALFQRDRTTEVDLFAKLVKLGWKVCDDPVGAAALQSLDHHPGTRHPVGDCQGPKDELQQCHHGVAHLQYVFQPPKHAPASEDSQELEQAHQAQDSQYLELLNRSVLPSDTHHRVRIEYELNYD